jgi:hypothetical protein
VVARQIIKSEQIQHRSTEGEKQALSRSRNKLLLSQKMCNLTSANGLETSETSRVVCLSFATASCCPTYLAGRFSNKLRGVGAAMCVFLLLPVSLCALALSLRNSVMSFAGA